MSTGRLRKVASSEARESRNLSHAKDFYPLAGAKSAGRSRRDQGSLSPSEEDSKWAGMMRSRPDSAITEWP